MTATARTEIEAVDYHTAGEPFRIVTTDVGPIPGDTILAKRAWVADNIDDVRKLLVFEPRGHADMYGCFVVEPEDDAGDLGVLFFHNAGYSTACGHGTIALVTWALESGRIPKDRESVFVDAPSGRLETFPTVDGDNVTAVRFRNVPSFVLKTDIPVRIGKSELRCDVSYGGAFYASFDAMTLGLQVVPENVGGFIPLGRAIKKEIEANYDIVHPEQPELRDVYGVIFFETLSEGPPLVQRNVAIFADGEVDRSPCGSGTSARLALLDASGQLPRGAELVHHSIIDTTFTARVVGDARVGDLPAVITEVKGSAHFTGSHRFVLEDNDDLGTGFLLR